ncbi:DUF3035 domain-containing protein [Formicincola oecophyllae]|nr:DUF3035 domain-containing protein [Formicincola oecophyllae]
MGAWSLAGCSGEDAMRAFGIKRTLPDEYTVLTRAPLAMPPSEKLVLPGAANANRPDESPRVQALQTLAPETALHTETGEGSKGQSELVLQAQHNAKAPHNAELGDADKGFVDSLMFWQGGGAGDVVDSKAENARIKRDSALGRSFSEGATPTTRKH